MGFFFLSFPPLKKCDIENLPKYFQILEKLVEFIYLGGWRGKKQKKSTSEKFLILLVLRK
jgi:hypothetical protein